MWSGRRRGVFGGGKDPGPSSVGAEHHEFWEQLEDAIRNAKFGLECGGGSSYQLFASNSWVGFQHHCGPGILRTSYGEPLWRKHELLEIVDSPFGHTVIYAAQNFLNELIRQIQSAANIQTLQRLAEPVLGVGRE